MNQVISVLRMQEHTRSLLRDPQCIQKLAAMGGSYTVAFVNAHTLVSGAWDWTVK